MKGFAKVGVYKERAQALHFPHFIDANKMWLWWLFQALLLPSGSRRIMEKSLIIREGALSGVPSFVNDPTIW